jgi:hypothetical protein
MKLRGGLASSILLSLVASGCGTQLSNVARDEMVASASNDAAVVLGINADVRINVSAGESDDAGWRRARQYLITRATRR